MSILTLSNVGQSFGAFDLFWGASGSVPNDGKVGLVGPNGVGKTTLLKIIAGMEPASGGTVHLSKGVSVGYLRQEAVAAFADKENSVWDEMLTVFAPLLEKEKELVRLEAQLAEGKPAVLTKYGEIQSEFEAGGGYDYEIRIKRTLSGLGFKDEQVNLPLNVLSGGQKTRALLCRLLLEKPDLLILDEPTNHLDIRAVEWLEGTLKSWEGAILVVSHDRYFLDRAVNTIWELRRDGMEVFRGNYSHYVTQREARWADRQRLFDEMKGGFLKELDYVKRNIARDSTKNMAVGRLKRLIRQVKLAQVAGPQAVLKTNWAKAMAQYEISGAKWEVPDVERAIKELPRPSGKLPNFNFDLRSKHRSGNIVMRTTDLAVGYDGVSLFQAENIELHRQECAALIGPNGAGKSSLLKTLLERLEPVEGEVMLGASLSVGYFAQAHDELNPENRVLDELIRHKEMLIPDARNWLGRFLFRGDDVYKPVNLLSGGERGRLALAILALNDANFLLLDEPTNHLDIPAQEALQAVLSQYDGTILMVTHDRYLVSALASQVWEIQDDSLKVYTGGYEGYLADRDRDRLPVVAGQKTEKRVESEKEKGESVGGDAPQTSNSQLPTPKLSKNAIRQREIVLVKLEDEIAEWEEVMSERSVELQAASASGDFEKISKASEGYGEAEKKVEELMGMWERVSAELASAT